MIETLLKGQEACLPVHLEALGYLEYTPQVQIFHFVPYIVYPHINFQYCYESAKQNSLLKQIHTYEVC